MADFEPFADKLVNTFEGLYSNDSDDSGGETVYGISIVENPNWDGWSLVNKIRNLPGFPKSIKNYPEILESAKQFYKPRYWDVFGGDDIDVQEIADLIADTAVNPGVKRAATYCQVALNCLDKNLKPDVVEDGSFGPSTNDLLIKFLNSSSHDELLVFMGIIIFQRGEHYIQYMEKDHKQRKYVIGWITRTLSPLLQNR